MNAITHERLRAICDGLGLECEDDGVKLTSTWSGDAAFPYDVTLAFTVDDANSELRAVGIAKDWTTPRARLADALRFVNACNRSSNYVRTLVADVPNDDDVNDNANDERPIALAVDMTLRLTEETTETYVKEKFVSIFVPSALRFFQEAVAALA